jgi:hypothetical protein
LAFAGCLTASARRDVGGKSHPWKAKGAAPGWCGARRAKGANWEIGAPGYDHLCSQGEAGDHIADGGCKRLGLGIMIRALLTPEVVPMKTRFLGFCVLVIAVVLVAIPLFAHHGGAVYDSTKWTTLKGTLVKFEFVNPHILLYIDVKGPNGEIQHWAIEHSPPSLSVHRGWYKNMAKAGDQVEFDVHAAKNGAFVGSGGDKILVNGKDPVAKAEPAAGAAAAY